jgi:predicted MFS family arabinose efflux permease
MSISRFIAWSVWMIASIFYAYQYVLRVMPNIMMNDIMQQFDINTAIFGQFSGIYYIGYSLMHIPIGIMLDRYGPRKVMTICIITSVFGLLPILFASHWVYPIIGRMLIGMGSSAAILGTFKIIRIAFSEDKFTRMLSFSVTIGLIGAIYGGGPVSYMCDLIGYQAVIEIFAVIGLILALITYIIVPEVKDYSQGTVINDIREVLSNKKVIWTCIFAGLMVGPLEGFADVWGTQFLKQSYGYDNNIAASMPSMIFIGMCFGAPLLSLIAEKSKNYLGTIIGAGLVMTLAFTLLVTGYMSVSTMSVSFILVGICSAYQIIAIYKASTYVQENVVGLTTAIANMIIMIFGYGFHSIIGYVIKIMGNYDLGSAFTYGIAVVPFALAVGTIGFSSLMYQEPKKQILSVE